MYQNFYGNSHSDNAFRVSRYLSFGEKIISYCLYAEIGEWAIFKNLKPLVLTKVYIYMGSRASSYLSYGTHFFKVLCLNVSNALTFSIVMMELIQYSNIRLRAGSSAIRLPSIWIEKIRAYALTRSLLMKKEGRRIRYLWLVVSLYIEDRKQRYLRSLNN